MTTDLSQPFYLFLCKKIGTEDIVKVRRLCNAMCDYLSAITITKSSIMSAASHTVCSIYIKWQQSRRLGLKG